MKQEKPIGLTTFNALQFQINLAETRLKNLIGVKHDPKAFARAFKDYARAIGMLEWELNSYGISAIQWPPNPGRPTKANGRWTNKRKPCPVCRDGRKMSKSRCARCATKRGESYGPIVKGPYHSPT